MNLYITSNQEVESFKKIAEELINNYLLKVNDAEIDLCDIEFYWNDGKDHEDQSTHHHQYGNGQLRPHDSGYDITLASEHGYGGILIRGIIKNSAATYGPIRCADVIFQSGNDLLSEGFHIKLLKREKPKNFLLFATTRIGLKKLGEFWDKDYRFIACRADYLHQIDHKERICKEIEQTVPGVDPKITKEALATPKRK